MIFTEQKHDINDQTRLMSGQSQDEAFMMMRFGTFLRIRTVTSTFLLGTSSPNELISILTRKLRHGY